MAQSDIRAYYGCIPASKLAQHIFDFGVPLPLAVAAVRLHTAPKMFIRVGTKTVQFGARTRAILTGSTSAAVLAKTPILNIARKRCRIWSQLGFRTAGGGCVSLVSWADNLLAAGPSADTAVAILEDAELYLRSDWILGISPDSRQYMTARGGVIAEQDLAPRGWQIVD